MTDQLVLAGASLALGGAVALGGPAWTFSTDALNGRMLARWRTEFAAVGLPAQRLALMLYSWRVLILVVLLAVWFGAQMPPIAVLLAFLTHQAAPVVLDYLATRQRQQLSAQTGTTARRLANQVRIGLPLMEALASVAQDTPAPLGRVLQQVSTELAQGKTTTAVLSDLRARLRVDALALFTTALQVAVEHGGRLADVLDRLALSLEEIQRIERKRAADTAAGRMMINVLALFPVVFLGYFATFDTELVGSLFATLNGQLIVTVAGFLAYGAWQWGQRLLQQLA
jgi:Flp pilus assembly protein TadB